MSGARILSDLLLGRLRQSGPATARELATMFDVSQSTISRALLPAGNQVVRIGSARRVRYAAVRDVRGLGSSWPVYRIDSLGRPDAFGQLMALHGAGALMTGAVADWLRDDFAEGVFPGVPWFLDDQRPQGFLGRQFAQRWSRETGLPADVLLWSDDAVLAGLLLHGEDGPGNFVLGAGALELALRAKAPAVPTTQRSERYAAMASAALAGHAVGPSAAGEQPKFTTSVRDAAGTVRHVIVKFSEPAHENPTARRWADLLVCEHLAAQLLTEKGDASAATELVWSDGRACLEATRFDRVGEHGRRGCVTLAAWSDAHDGERDNWPGATERMKRAGWVEQATVDDVRHRWWFGRLIANTDMHFGNLCFFLDAALPLTLAPGYDMLPMLYRPAGNGAVVPREFQPPAPVPGDTDSWRRAARWAEEYWVRVAACDDISAGFRDIATSNARAVATSRQRFGM